MNLPSLSSFGIYFFEEANHHSFPTLKTHARCLLCTRRCVCFCLSGCHSRRESAFAFDVGVTLVLFLCHPAGNLLLLFLFVVAVAVILTMGLSKGRGPEELHRATADTIFSALTPNPELRSSPFPTVIYNFFLQNSPKIACQVPKPSNSLKINNIEVEV
jgi:hypothetical protein